MNCLTPHDNATSNVLAWTSQCANVESCADEEAGNDADEPPERQPPLSPIANHFKRAPIRRGSEHESLLTKALQSHSEDDTADEPYSNKALRRRSVTSNFSLASTAELTCDTGITTPARTSSPSPRLPDVGFVPLTTTVKKTVAVAASPRLAPSVAQPAAGNQQLKDPAVQALEKKRCISFACAAKPKPDDKMLMPPPPKHSSEVPKPPAQETVKRPSISFACAARPQRNIPSEPREVAATPVLSKLNLTQDTLATAQLQRSPSTVRHMRSPSARRISQSPTRVRSKKIIRTDSRDLQGESARFHEFASDEPQNDDWVIRDDPSSKGKLTIYDTLEKENAIRKLGKEAEEEAELEEQIDEDDTQEVEADDGDDIEEEDVEDLSGDEDDWSGYGSDDDASDGYNSDNEGGFADSDDEDDDLLLWTTRELGQLSFSGATPVRRRPSFTGDHSDSSISSRRAHGTGRVRKSSRAEKMVFRPGTPELPDSTDFVCGTLDEDRPLEDAYISCIAARKREKRVLIPQDIDPSFPASEPEDEVDDSFINHDESDNFLIHGELEDLHHGQERSGRKKKSDNHSPKRYRSPPPKRFHSPAPKVRGRSPKRLFDNPSPRRLRSPPPPQASNSPPASPVQEGEGIAFKSLAFRPGLTHTKSLPRSPALFPLLKSRRGRAGTVTRENHVRGAIDIFKGLEQKRQRRKEKFYQKYCNRARKEKAQEKRPPPGQGAERMKEIGLLLMASKTGQGNYVLSV